MDMSMFTGFAGRINRAKWWIGAIILAVILVVLYLVLMAIFGAGALTDPAQISSMLRTAAIIQLIVFAVLAYPITAIMMKRLNDRDRPSYFAYIFWAPVVLSLLGGIVGLTVTTIDMGGVAMPIQTGLGWILSLLSLAVFIWMLIELGVLKGTEGPNQHGPDPLAQ